MRVPLPVLLLIAAAFNSGCCAAKHREAASLDPAAMALLQSPLFEPLSEVAFHITELQNKLPQMSRFLEEGSPAIDQLAHVSSLISWVSSHMKHVMALMSAPFGATLQADLAGIFSVIRRKLEQAIASVYVLTRMKGAESFGSYADALREAAEKALKATLSLRPRLLEKSRASGGPAVESLLPSNAHYDIVREADNLHENHSVREPRFIERVHSGLQGARAEVEDRLQKAFDFLVALKQNTTGDSVAWERAAALRAFMDNKNSRKVPAIGNIDESIEATKNALQRTGRPNPSTKPADSLPAPWPEMMTTLHVLHTAVVPELGGLLEKILAAEKRLDGIRKKLRGASFLHHSVGSALSATEQSKETDGQQTDAPEGAESDFVFIGGIPYLDL